MKAVQQLIDNHFNSEKSMNIIYAKTGSDYEKSLLELPYTFFEAPTNPINSYNGIRFDLVLSQSQEQLKDLMNLSHMLHAPILHVEPNYFNGNPGLFAHEYIFPWHTQAQSWNKTLSIAPTIKMQPNTNSRELDCIYIDVDPQTQQLGQALAQKFRVKQIPGDSTDFSRCGILVNLIGNPGAQPRMLKAFSQGVVIITWNAPFFQEIILDKQTGFLCNSPDEMVQTIEGLMQNLSRVHAVHKTILSLGESKFSDRLFQDRWKQVINKWTNRIYKGVQT